MTGSIFWLAVVMYVLALGAAFWGVQQALSLWSVAAARRPGGTARALICFLAALLVYPATFIAVKLIPYFVTHVDSMHGVVALLIGLGSTALASLIATRMLLPRSV